MDSWRPGPTGSFSEFKERGRKPDPFTGSRDKSEEFLMTFGTYLRFNKHLYPTESERVDLFLSYIDHTWRVHRQRELELDEDKPKKDRRWQTLQSIRHRFRNDFGVLDEEGKAHTDMEKLSMAGDYARLDDYITAFETIAPRTGYNDKALLRFFKKGLNDPLR